MTLRNHRYQAMSEQDQAQSRHSGTLLLCACIRPTHPFRHYQYMHMGKVWIRREMQCVAQAWSARHPNSEEGTRTQTHRTHKSMIRELELQRHRARRRRNSHSRFGILTCRVTVGQSTALACHTGVHRQLSPPLARTHCIAR